jgi:HPt (histidine-containing phosphotransfer) domain-containing protein
VWDLATGQVVRMLRTGEVFFPRFGYRGTPTTLEHVRREPEMAANLSAVQLHFLAADLEAVCHAGEFEPASQLITDLRKESTRCLNFIARHLEAHAVLASR